MTRRPLVLQLHKIDEGQTEYAEFLHLPKRRFTDFGMLISLMVVILHKTEMIPVLFACINQFIGIIE